MEKLDNWWQVGAFERNDSLKKEIDENFNDIKKKVEGEEKKKNECFTKVELENMIEKDLNKKTKNYMKKKEFKEYVNEKKKEIFKNNDLKKM